MGHTSLAHTHIYARLNTKAVNRAVQQQADRFTAVQQQSAHAVLALEDRHERDQAQVAVHRMMRE